MDCFVDCVTLCVVDGPEFPVDTQFLKHQIGQFAVDVHAIVAEDAFGGYSEFGKDSVEHEIEQVDRFLIRDFGHP